jgi:hypothetical protein
MIQVMNGGEEEEGEEEPRKEPLVSIQLLSLRDF